MKSLTAISIIFVETVLFCEVLVPNRQTINFFDMHTSLFPIAFPHNSPLPDGSTVMAADVGGTKTDLALFEVKDGGLLHIKETVFPSKEWKSLSAMVRHFDTGLPLPDRLSIAFAGPIQNGKAKATNLDWSVDSGELRSELGISGVLLINDLEAEAYGLAALTEQDIKTIYAGNGTSGGNASIIAPGTGLGEAGLFWDGSALHPFATEGGHADFSVRNKLDWELLKYLQSIYGKHVSWERVLSGPGIHALFTFLRDVKDRPEHGLVREIMKGHDPAEAISLAASEGDSLCQETLRLFTGYLAVEASNLALKFKSTGGVFIGGGILPKIWNESLEAVFLEHFFETGRLRPLIESVPVHLVLNSKTAMLGAGMYGIFAG